jgi:copper chaperone NosL
MFVGKYPDWLTQIRFADGRVAFFDGVKDMMAYYHDPRAFGGKGEKVAALWVKEYYSLAWLPAEEAHYVLGSDVHGPMGHELIPFASRAAAENFRADHKGDRILRFAEISAGLIRSLRSGEKMR